MRRRAVAAIILAAALAAGWWSVGGAGPAAAKSQSRPNIVVIVTDDQTLAQLSEATMPNTLELIGGQGTTFTDSIAVTPLCCPSRAAMITGQYGHNNGVLANAAGYKMLRDKRNVLPAWLQAAGYTTAHVGRWLQGLGKRAQRRPGPGWDSWFTLGESRTYYDYKLLDGHEEVHYGERSRDYVTRVLNQEALRVVRREIPRRAPLYLQLDELAPHADGINGEPAGPCAHSAIPPSRAPVGFEDVPLPMPPSFNEQDVADKPSFMSVQPSLSDEQVAELERQYRCRLASLPAVDEGVRRIVGALEQAGELDDTAIVFTSDNGYFFGEHRVPTEKYLPYEEDVHLPLLIRFPAGVAPGGTTVGAPVANIDLAPTLLELAGGTPCARGACRVMDGRSLVALAQGESTGWPDDRALLLELRRTRGEADARLPCIYAGVRVAGQVYVEYTSVPDLAGECHPGLEVEHYDLEADPYELTNLSPPPPGGALEQAESQLSQRVAALRDCAGIAGRDPAPASGHYCE